MKRIERVFLVAAAVALLVLLVGVTMGAPALWRPAAIVGTTALAIGLGSVSSLGTFRFTAWIVAAVTAAILAPALFRPFEPGSPSYKLMLLLLIQMVMFGMGTQMSLRDFAGVIRAPWPVAVGVFCQFTIMPLLGYGLAKAFRLPDEIAAGLVLIGACSSGLASNVMVYISGANLALSITLTRRHHAVGARGHAILVYISCRRYAGRHIDSAELRADDGRHHQNRARADRSSADS